MPKRRIHQAVIKTLRVNNDLSSESTSVVLGSGDLVDLNGQADALVFDADADTTMSSPTDDQLDIEIGGVDHVVMKGVAGADAAVTTHIVEIAFTSPVDTTGTNVHNALDIDVEVGNATGGTNTVRAIMIDAITDDAQVTTVGIEVGSGWDSGIKTNTIDETTAAAGVTIDGTLLKDGTSNGRRQSQALTASGAITVGRFGVVTLAHATVIIAATLAAPTAGDDLIIVNTSASGTVAHTVTLPAGVTWDGTNNTATLDAPEEALHVVAVSATRWKIMENIGSVALSNV